MKTENMSEEASLRNQIRYLTDLINNAKSRQTTLDQERGTIRKPPSHFHETKAQQKKIWQGTKNTRQMKEGPVNDYLHKQDKHCRNVSSNRTTLSKAAKYVWTKKSNTGGQSGLPQPDTKKSVSDKTVSLPLNFSIVNSGPKKQQSDQKSKQKSVTSGLNTTSLSELERATKSLGSPTKNSLSRGLTSSVFSKSSLSKPVKKLSFSYSKNSNINSSSSTSISQTLSSTPVSSIDNIQSSSNSSVLSDSQKKSFPSALPYTVTENSKPVVKTQEQTEALKTNENVISLTVSNPSTDRKIGQKDRKVDHDSEKKLSVIPSFLKYHLCKKTSNESNVLIPEKTQGMKLPGTCPRQLSSSPSLPVSRPSHTSQVSTSLSDLTQSALSAKSVLHGTSSVINTDASILMSNAAKEMPTSVISSDLRKSDTIEGKYSNTTKTTATETVGKGDITSKNVQSCPEVSTSNCQSTQGDVFLGSRGFSSPGKMTNRTSTFSEVAVSDLITCVSTSQEYSTMLSTQNSDPVYASSSSVISVSWSHDQTRKNYGDVVRSSEFGRNTNDLNVHTSVLTRISSAPSNISVSSNHPNFEQSNIRISKSLKSSSSTLQVGDKVKKVENQPTASASSSVKLATLPSNSSPANSPIKRTESRRDAMMELSQKLAKAQAEIKLMTQNITNSQVTLASIAAINKDKSAQRHPVVNHRSFNVSQHTRDIKGNNGIHTELRHYKNISSNGSNRSLRKIHSFPKSYTRSNSSRFHPYLKATYSCPTNAPVIFNPKYSLKKASSGTTRQIDLELGSPSCQLTRSSLARSKTQAVAKVIKSKYKLRKVILQGKTPPLYRSSTHPVFPIGKFPYRGYPSTSLYSYRSQKSIRRKMESYWMNARHPHRDRKHLPYNLKKHATHFRYGTGHYKKSPVYTGSYGGFFYAHKPSPKFRTPHQLKSRVIFDKKYVLKRLQHDRRTPAVRFKYDKRTKLQHEKSVSSELLPVYGTPPSHGNNKTFTSSNSVKNRFVVINGMLYKSSNNSLVKTSPDKSASSMMQGHRSKVKDNRILVKKIKQKKMSLVTVRGVQFQMDSSGKTLRRVNTDQPSSVMKGSVQNSQATVNRLDIGGVTYVRNSDGILERIGSASSRVIANRMIHRSLAAVTAKSKKTNTKSKKHCIFFNRFGKCKRGNNCPYIHDPEKVAVCTRFLRGTCQMKGCPFSHKVAKEKMPVCSYFLKGICNRDNCPYLHVKVNRNAAVCQDFIKGYCPLGEKCKKKHTLECQVYTKTGHCPSGQSCPLIHKKKRSRGPTKQTSVRRMHNSVTEELPQKRPAAEMSQEEDESQSIPFKTRKLPTFISLDSNTEQPLVVNPPSSSDESIRIKPML